MSIWDYFRRTPPAPPVTPLPSVPTQEKEVKTNLPPAPPIDPAISQRRINAILRYEADATVWSKSIKYVNNIRVMPPHPPSVDYYENHPNYVWSPDEPNPELPPPPIVETVSMSVFIDGVFITNVMIRKSYDEQHIRLVVMNDDKVKTFIMGKTTITTDYSIDKGIYRMVTIDLVSASTRRQNDVNRYIEAQRKSPFKRLQAPPPLSYYLGNPNYVWTSEPHKS